MTNTELSLSQLAALWMNPTKDNQAINDTIRKLLLEKIPTNIKYSKESIVQSINQKNALHLELIPESDNFIDYGQHVTILYVDETRDDFTQILENIVKKEVSYGTIKLIGRRAGSTTNEKMNINTRHILEIEPS